jgi:hypothetical protein|tara:strand:- start:450 stop:911 length:462 start_codon:yes stop_codon:yes gene_type:complete
MIKRFFCAILIILGVYLIVFSHANITGNVVSDNVVNLSGLFGLVFAILGIILIFELQALEGKSLSKGERQRIKSAFRGWSGKLTGEQKRILRGYGMESEKTGGGHLAIYFPNSSNKVYTSSTPSDSRTGLNFALKQLIPYIEENREEERRRAA